MVALPAPQAAGAIRAIPRVVRLVGHSEVAVVAVGDILGDGELV